MVEVEDDPVLEELEEELEDGDFEDSEVEEVEGYASLSDNENDDYIGEGEENE
ncbi:hypothetical protein SESBI_41957 [Sesbania bispinosa]|nr:hypothetical protein SESBI_41957 [Sesbania bispinosa]